MKANRRLQQFRFPQKTVALLSKEASETNRTKTMILEIAFAHYMSLKREYRLKLNPSLGLNGQRRAAA